MYNILAEVETAQQLLVLYSMRLLQPHQIWLCLLNHQQDIRRKRSNGSLLLMSLVLQQLLQPPRQSLWLHILQAAADELVLDEHREVLLTVKHQRLKGWRLTVDSQPLVKHLTAASQSLAAAARLVSRHQRACP